MDTNSDNQVGFVELQLEDKRVLLVGTAHISQESVALVEKTIDEEKPDTVCVELDAKRLEALRNPDRWRSLDLRVVIKAKQLPTLIANLVLSSYQRRLGVGTGTLPGAELLIAVEAAEKRGIPIVLADREIKVTLSRLWRLASWKKKFVLLGTLFGSLFEKEELNEEKLRELQQEETLSALLQEMGESLPILKEVLIDERDQVLAERIRQAPGKCVVAVVGAGHLIGIQKHLKEAPQPLEPILALPPPSPWGKIIGWGVPIAIITAVLLTLRVDPKAAQEGVLIWIFATGSLCALGGIIALAHPLTILTGLVAAPITTLSPVLGASYFTGLAQIFLSPPKVGELESLPDDLTNWKKWWSNRALKVFLVFILTGVGAAAGNLIGTVEVYRRLISVL